MQITWLEFREVVALVREIREAQLEVDRLDKERQDLDVCGC